MIKYLIFIKYFLSYYFILNYTKILYFSDRHDRHGHLLLHDRHGHHVLLHGRALH